MKYKQQKETLQLNIFVWENEAWYFVGRKFIRNTKPLFSQKDFISLTKYYLLQKLQIKVQSLHKAKFGVHR